MRWHRPRPGRVRLKEHCLLPPCRLWRQTPQSGPAAPPAAKGLVGISSMVGSNTQSTEEMPRVLGAERSLLGSLVEFKGKV